MPARTWYAGAMLAIVMGASPHHALARDLDTIIHHRDEGRVQRALDAASLAIASSPEDADLRLLRGQLLYREGRVSDAVDELLRARQLAPDYLDVQLALARALRAADRLPEARDALEAGLALDPDDPRLRLEAARLALARDEHDAALHHLNEVRDKGDERVAEHDLLRGDIHASRNAFIAAKLNYERALEAEGFERLARERLAGIEPETTRWQLIGAGSVSTFDGSDREAWREGLTELSFKLDDLTEIRGILEGRRRFGEIDQTIGAGLTHRFSPTMVGFTTFRVTPSADFRPNEDVDIGLDTEVRSGAGAIGPTIALLRGKLDRFDQEFGAGLSIGLTQYLNGSFLTALAGLSRTTEGAVDPSFGARLDLRITDSLRLSFAAARAEETENGESARTHTLATGARIEVTDTVDLFAEVALEERQDVPTRHTFTTGFVVKF